MEGALRSLRGGRARKHLGHLDKRRQKSARGTERGGERERAPQRERRTRERRTRERSGFVVSVLFVRYATRRRANGLTYTPQRLRGCSFGSKMERSVRRRHDGVALLVCVPPAVLVSFKSHFVCAYPRKSRSRRELRRVEACLAVGSSLCQGVGWELGIKRAEEGVESGG